ncbi:MAG: hypothetical protein HYT75_02650 [Deltaproteobacteria bacterium]|nr:hypothetical protein [Deltaproteobacteria bacterium]
MKGIVLFSIAICLTFGGAGTAFSWSLGADVKTTVNNNKNSNNNNSVNGSDIKTNANSNNSYKNSNNKATNNNQKYTYDNDVDNSVKTSSYDYSDKSTLGSYNTDSHAIADSFKGNTFEYDSSAGKRVASHNIEGGARNSVLGDFSQKIGADFSSTISATTVEASVNNSQTFGDVHVSTPATE